MKKMNLNIFPFQREKFLEIEETFNDLLEKLAKQGIIEIEEEKEENKEKE